MRHHADLFQEWRLRYKYINSGAQFVLFCSCIANKTLLVKNEGHLLEMKATNKNSHSCGVSTENLRSAALCL